MAKHVRLYGIVLILAAALVRADAPASPKGTPPTGTTPTAPLPVRWTYSKPLIGPATRPADPCCAVKDPTVVFHDKRWHVFSTIRSEKRTHQIEYVNFREWNDAAAAERHVLTMSDEYFCAPQVFWFEPQKTWYMILQVVETGQQAGLRPAFSTNAKLDDPAGWSKPKLMYEKKPENLKGWIDFWVICDDANAHLFFTSNDGRMWRAETKLGDFPLGWSTPTVALQADVFEASHTYKLKDRPAYLTIIEAQGPGGRRYYKAYLADKLDGDWKPAGDTWDKPFAGMTNVKPANGVESWTESISHGELLRAGIDQRLEVDPVRLRFLFQGVSDKERAGKKYGQIPWRLGLLTSEP